MLTARGLSAEPLARAGGAFCFGPHFLHRGRGPDACAERCARCYRLSDRKRLSACVRTGSLRLGEVPFHGDASGFG